MIFEKKIMGLYKQVLGTRNDPTGDVFYYSPSDFEGLSYDSFEFKGSFSQTLRGRVYYRGEKNLKKLIVFDHGMGCGHVAYLREIDLLTRHSYTVITYDHTGCLSSDGDSIRGFAQSLADLDYLFRYLKSCEEYKNASFSVIGHSWGGFSTLNISPLHPEITHVVAMSGFISVDAILSQTFPGILSVYKKLALEEERKNVPDYVEFNAIGSLRFSKARAMIIHSSDDDMVSIKLHFYKLRDALSDRKNTIFLELSGKRHNPTYSDNAVRLLAERKKKLSAFRKKHKNPTDDEKAAFVASFDWSAMTEQDMEIWDKIFAFLES